MNTEQIKERIQKLEDERSTLTTQHDEAMKHWQEIILTNRNKYQWLTGAIDELKLQLNGDTDG